MKERGRGSATGYDEKRKKGERYERYKGKEERDMDGGNDDEMIRGKERERGRVDNKIMKNQGD